jgi:hypothetical protein
MGSVLTVCCNAEKHFESHFRNDLRRFTEVDAALQIRLRQKFVHQPHTNVVAPANTPRVQKPTQAIVFAHQQQ